MQPRCYFAFTLLCSLSLLSPVLSMQCNATQYEWPAQDPKYCCNMCPPGTHMEGRSDPCRIVCKPCQEEMFKDVYSVAQSCRFCKNCNGANMEYETPCNATHDAVCRCKAGYECQDQSCTGCVPIQTTTKPTLPPSTTGRISLLQTFSQTLFLCLRKFTFLFWMGVDIGHLRVSI